MIHYLDKLSLRENISYIHPKIESEISGKRSNSSKWINLE